MRKVLKIFLTCIILAVTIVTILVVKTIYVELTKPRPAAYWAEEDEEEKRKTNEYFETLYNEENRTAAEEERKREE